MKRKKKTLPENFKKLWNMRVTMIPIIADALENFPKVPKRREGRLEESESRVKIETI